MKYSLFFLALLISCSQDQEESVEHEESLQEKKEYKAEGPGSYRKSEAETLKEIVEDSSEFNKNMIVEEVELRDKASCKVELEAYIDDPSETATNIRQTPGGEIILKLPYAQDDYFLTITGQKGSWFKAIAIEGIEHEYKLPEGGAWVHNSVVGASTRNYGSQKIKLHEFDDQNSRVVGTITIETALQVIAVCGDWVKIQTKSDFKTGWIKKEWICGNPLTTCS